MDAIQLTSATAFEILQPTGIMWRLCSDDAGAWVDAFIRAHQALQFAGKVFGLESGPCFSDKSTGDIVNGATAIVEIFQARGKPSLRRQRLLESVRRARSSNAVVSYADNPI